MLSRLHHRNLVKLIGICIEDNTRCLVYELVSKGSVESHLHGVEKRNRPLDWDSRLKIALGAARGLAYLHEDSNPRVIHRDFKASNVLLEDDFTPKVSNFGLAREATEESSHHISTRVMGTFGNTLRDYHSTIKSLTCEVLKLIAQGLNIEQDVIANFIKERKSDCLLRVNHYPPCSYMRESRGKNLLSFGEHTDPQIISLLWSNNTSGLEICLKDGSWVSVPSDPSSIFVAVGDCLQVMTNGRFQSVKHRVATNGLISRVSIIYFGGPSLPRTIAPLPKLLEMGEKTLYKKFTWEDYREVAGKSKFGDGRLSKFKK